MVEIYNYLLINNWHLVPSNKVVPVIKYLPVLDPKFRRRIRVVVLSFEVWSERKTQLNFSLSRIFSRAGVYDDVNDEHRSSVFSYSAYSTAAIGRDGRKRELMPMFRKKFISPSFLFAWKVSSSLSTMKNLLVVVGRASWARNSAAQRRRRQGRGWARLLRTSGLRRHENGQTKRRGQSNTRTRKNYSANLN